MINKALYKSGFNFVTVIISITLLLLGLSGLVNDYILFFFIYTVIWYFIFSLRLTKVELYIDNMLIRYPLCFCIKDRNIKYSTVIEFRHYSIPRGQDLIKAEYKDVNGKIRIIAFPCGIPEGKMLMEELGEIHNNISYTVHESFLHSMK